MVTAFASISGAAVAAFLTGFVNPYWCFGYYAIFSAFVIASACCLNMELEYESDFDVAMYCIVDGRYTGRRRKFCDELKHNYHIVKNEFKMRLFQRVMLFYVVLGLTHCRFDDFMYYYKLNVLGFTQFQYSCFSIGGACCMTIAVVLYQRFMTKWETRTMVKLTIALMFLNGLSSLILTTRFNVTMGISDMVFVAMTGTTFFPMVMAFYIIPPFVLVAKITPAHVEATIFSFAASVINAGIHFGGKYMGLAWNSLFFDVDTDNLDDLWKLCLLETVCCLFCLLYVPLIPTWDEVRDQQAHLKELIEMTAIEEDDCEEKEDEDKGM